MMKGDGMQERESPDKDWLTVREFCERFRLSSTLVYQEVNVGSIPSIRVGGKILIRSDALDTLLGASGEAMEEA